jgi:hypothetical protein
MERQETMRTMSVIRFVFFGAVGFGIGWVFAGFFNTDAATSTTPVVHQCRKIRTGSPQYV